MSLPSLGGRCQRSKTLRNDEPPLFRSDSNQVTGPGETWSNLLGRFPSLNGIMNNCQHPEYGGLKLDEARRLKELDLENATLKRLLTELSLETLVLKDIASGNF